MMKTWKSMGALAVALTLMPMLGLAKPEVFSNIPLLGTEEVPPVSSPGYGALTAIYDEDTNTLYYEYEWELGEDNEAVAAHFHGPAARGENASVAVDVGEGIAGKSGKITGMVMLSDAEEVDLKAGLWYLNIHSVEVPSGELRGQLVEMSPLDSAAVYDAGEGKLELESVMVPGLGIFEAEMKILTNRPILSFELDDAHVKELDDDDSSDEDGPDDDSAADDDSTGDDNRDMSSDGSTY
jgi:hypothetical protein